jgi:hypothetical protein
LSDLCWAVVSVKVATPTCGTARPFLQKMGPFSVKGLTLGHSSVVGHTVCCNNSVILKLKV